MTATVAIVASGALVGAPSAAAIDRPVIDPAAAPPDGPPGPEQPMRQTTYCTEVGVLPGTDFRVQPKYMDMLNLPEAWRFGRGAGVTVAVIDTGVTPHPRLPNLIGGGDYVGGGDGLYDCDAHGTLVASLIAAAPANGVTPVPPPRQTRPPAPHPTTEPPPSLPTVTTVTMMPAPSPPPAPPPSPPPEGGPEGGPAPGPGAGPAANFGGAGDTVVSADYSGGARVIAVDHRRPATPPPGTDAFSGVAPDVELISIRQTSNTFGLKDPFADQGDPQAREKADTMRTLARAIVHAANMGASVINISEVVCMNARTIIDQPELGGAVYYAAHDRDAVIVVAAGDTGKRDCKANPSPDPLQPNDPRGWNNVNTVVTPAWFDEHVLTVGAVDSSGVPTKTSVAGPWVRIAAPGTDIEGLSPRDDGLMNAVDGPENSLLVPTGTGFSTAIVSGVAALVRAKYPQLSSTQIINRLIHTAHPPARGVDNQVGYGIVDPVAALTWDVPDNAALPNPRSAPLQVPPMPPARNMTPIWVAGAGLAALLLAAFATFGAAKLLRRPEGD